jgi:hypothetical protein
MNAPSLLTRLIVPQEVRYDGVQETKRGRLLCFTDLETHGSFSILEAEATSVALARITAQIRRSFRAPSAPLPPPMQRHPRQFAAPDVNHF